MAGRRRFRILAPDGRLSPDRYYIAAQQPRTIKPGCLLVVHEGTGATLSVADIQLFPAEAIHVAPLSDNATRICLSRGLLPEQLAAAGTPASVLGRAPLVEWPAAPHVELTGTGA